jgi:class 3 adenylate cyclase
MRAWTVDADDIRVAEDFDDALIHRTPEIDSFLNLDRDDKFIVIGTKGFGKTLLLKAKRVLYQRDGRAACLPSGNLLDKPIGDKIFTKEALAFFGASSLPWSRAWLTAVAAATLKRLDQARGLKVTAKLAGLISDERLHSVIDHFVRLLDFSPSELQRCATDTDGHLVPRLRAVSSPVAIFIDGIDEYFNKHIESQALHPSVTGPLSPDVWYFAQLGLVEVAYQLRRINHHLKIFAAVRKEAYARLETTVMSQQYRGSAVDIVYPVASLREIFLNNVRLERSNRMVRPERARAAPLDAFFGRTKVTHVYTGEEEDVFDYVCRHTLLRPRDLMTIGERLATIRPEDRRDEARLKEAVNVAATEIAHEYLIEVAPHVAEVDLDRLLRRLPGHVLSRAEVEELFRKHNGETGALDEKHVFCALYRIGLLGCVGHDPVRGEWVQRFARPGEATLAPDGVLPRASHYLVHPVLAEVIGRVNPAYAQRVDRVTIVGYGRPWRGATGADTPVTARTLCVLAGDIAGFGSMMRAGADAPVRQALAAAVRKWGHEAITTETSEGDALWIVNDDPVALAQIARHIMDEVYRAPGQPRLRIALHHGEVQTRPRPDGTPAIAGGDAVLCAARVEPRVPPGQIWATEEFREQLAQKPSLWRTTAVVGPDGADRVNVKKEAAGETDLWVRLHRLEF